MEIYSPVGKHLPKAVAIMVLHFQTPRSDTSFSFRPMLSWAHAFPFAIRVYIFIWIYMIDISQHQRTQAIRIQIHLALLIQYIAEWQSYCEFVLLLDFCVCPMPFLHYVQCSAPISLLFAKSFSCSIWKGFCVIFHIFSPLIFAPFLWISFLFIFILLCASCMLAKWLCLFVSLCLCHFA